MLRCRHNAKGLMTWDLLKLLQMRVGNIASYPDIIHHSRRIGSLLFIPPLETQSYIPWPPLAMLYRRKTVGRSFKTALLWCLHKQLTCLSQICGTMLQGGLVIRFTHRNGILLSSALLICLSQSSVQSCEMYSYFGLSMTSRELVQLE